MDITQIIPGLRALVTISTASPVIKFLEEKNIDKKVQDKKDFLSALNGLDGIYMKSQTDAGKLLDDFRDQQSERGFVSGLIYIERTGLLGVGNSWNEANHYLKQFVKGTTVSFIEKESKQARLRNKVVIVTGGAQGFGKGIVEEMIDEGAYVMIADINDEKGKKTVDEINVKKGKNHAFYVNTDVTDSASVKNLVYETVKEFGGLDVLISNAGVLKAGGIEDLDEKTFDFVTGVNYKGFFICTKYCSPIMKLQQAFNDNLFMDIIQINSKSGLEGSNKNFVYAGSKFGGIGLTQSFALELIPYNIKVNAICPGNYFEGPLWSDPENGLFAQYLKTGKVKGAKTVEEVKKAYENKVPMGRGCKPADVVKAIYYLIEQNYETGQAIPVTGGQVMLK